jgi:hypothetical protein
MRGALEQVAPGTVEPGGQAPSSDIVSDQMQVSRRMAGRSVLGSSARLA